MELSSSAQEEATTQRAIITLHHDSLTVFQAQPLVWFDHDGNCYPMDAPDFAKEKRELIKAIDEANKKQQQQQEEFGTRAVHVLFEEASVGRLGACLATGCSPVLHFSCHGNPDYLAIENKGAMQPFLVGQLKEFVAAGGKQEEGRRLKLVFVSACHSLPAGCAFREAGVDHVVCCKTDASLRDVAASVFAQSFYQALACKRKLKAAFNIARQAVLCSPDVINAKLEMSNFLLLPKRPDNDPYHDVDIFFTEPTTMRRETGKSSIATTNLPPPPPVLFGREVDMYEMVKGLVLDSVNPRLFLVRGPKGIGKGSLTTAVCSYVADRQRTFSVDNCEWVSPLYCTDSSLSAILRELYKMIQNESIQAVGCEAFTSCLERFVKAAYSMCAVVAIDARELKRESAMKKLDKFLLNVFLLTHHVRVIVICPAGHNYSFSAGCLTKRLSLGPLDLHSSLKLFGNYCEFVEQGRVRGVRSASDFADILDPQTPDGSENPRAHEIASIIGEGIPARIHENAMNMSQANYDDLMRIGVLQLEEQISAVSDQLRSKSSISETEKLKQVLEDLSSARDSLPSVHELTHDPSELVSVQPAQLDHPDEKLEEKQNDTASLSSSSSAGSVIGFEFSGANMDDRTTWTENIIRSKRQMEKLLQKLLLFGDLLDGETCISVETIESNGRERAVVSLDCEFKLRDDLAPYDDQRVRRIFGKIVGFLKKAGATPDELEDMVIGAAYLGSIVLVLEAPSTVFKKLFRAFVKGGRRIVLSVPDAVYVSAISPAFLVKGPFKLLQEKEFIHWQEEERPDAVIWKETCLSLLVPMSPVSMDKLMNGGIQIECWQQVAEVSLKAMPLILPMRLGSTPEDLLKQPWDGQSSVQAQQSTQDKLLSISAGSEEIDDACNLTETLSRSGEVGKGYLESRWKTVNPESQTDSPTRDPSLSKEVLKLIEKRDIFSLICMLRVNNGDKNLDAAVALMRFAKGEDGVTEAETTQLRGEIKALGGMEALLSLFSAKCTPYQLKVVAAMTVFHLSQSFIISNDISSGGIGLKIIECLRFLSNAPPVSPRGIEISADEMLNAATLAAADFWLNGLVPVLHRSETEQRDEPRDDNAVSSGHAVSHRFRGRRLQVGPSGGFIEEPQETLEVQELVETAVSLMVHLSKIDRSSKGGKSTGEESLVSRYTLVEHVCGVDAARPIAVREGVLKIIVDWLQSKDRDRILPAATSLRHLTSTEDKYMAGWIHSQMVNEDTLGDIVGLLGNPYVGYDVRLAVAEILSSLCIAPQTRAALVNANCTRFLTSVLLDPESPQIVHAVASTLLKLAAGAIASSSVYGSGNLRSYKDVSSDRSVDVIDDIIRFGAIEKFVEMAASEKQGKLRLTSIEALRVISEDVNPSRGIRLTLCNEGAVKALGRVLSEDVHDLYHPLELDDSTLLEGKTKSGKKQKETLASKDSVMELYHALCALANVLEPVKNDISVARLNSEDLLLKCCIQTAESGGLQSLLRISSLPSQPSLHCDSIGRTDFVIESCRCLASISSFLLTEPAADAGLAGWACEVLAALTVVLKQASAGDDGDNAGFTRELQFDALRGIASLAELEPLKLMIVDQSLPVLLEAKDSRGDRTDISNVASQVCLALGFTENEIAVQVAGNDPKLLGDWFCLQRSLIIQSMAREEIRKAVSKLWKDAVHDLRKKGILPTKLVRETSGNSSHSSGRSSSNEGSGESKSDDKSSSEEFFEFLDDGDGFAADRRKILKHYHDIFERGAPRTKDMPCGRNGGSAANPFGLLSRHVYPLNQVATEKEWILGHGRAIENGMKGSEALQYSSNPVDGRVRKLLDCCFPSRLLQKQVLPVNDVRPDASYNFGALLMPQRRYFSFRREGQLLSRLCDKHAISTGSEDGHWTLGFTNSSFAGEFTETLVQALYRCPIIQGLSFARNSDWDSVYAGDQETEDLDGSALLVDLFGSLPPWISALTFDGILSESFIKSLVEILEMMGKLSAGADQESSSSSLPQAPGARDTVGQKQGTFRCIALRNSPQVGVEAFKEFFALLGSSRPGPRKPHFKPALSQLRVLDLSGNNLGDDLCARVLDLAHKPNSGCLVENLDMSGNSIGKGAHIQNILWVYVKQYRENQRRGMQLERKSWCSPLHTLNLSSNRLCEGGLTLQLILWLKNCTLNLKSLDLSDNGLKDNPYDNLSDVLCDSLNKNTTLMELDMSSNKFSGAFLNATLERLNNSESQAGVPFIRFDYNVPPLSGDQKGMLSTFTRKSRHVALERYMYQKEQAKTDSQEDDVTTARRSLTQETGLPPIPERKDRELKPERPKDAVDEVSLVSQSESSLGTSSSITRQRRSTHENMIAVLFSAPLVYTAEGEGLQPFQKLDFDMERELMWQCLKEACRDIELSFDNATSDRLVATMTKRCSCLHYSGHGHTQFLPLESGTGNGATDWLPVKKLEELISGGEHEGGAPFKFVFVSACYSYLAGETFASAGVKHVVCCQQNSELKDAAALAFTRQFYLALAVGRTVKESFEQGCKAVRLTPNIKDPDKEMEKFVLLPKDGRHDVPVFDARPLLEWPTPHSSMRMGSHSRSRRGLMRSRSVNIGGARSSELHVRNMIQEDPSPTPPQFFLGREVDMHLVMDAILTKRLVSVISPAGYGSSSLACALCHYINERRNTIRIEAIYYVKAKRSLRGDRKVSFIQPFVKKLQEARRLDSVEEGADVDSVFERIFKCLRKTKALIVFDGTELLEGSEEAQDFPLFLSGLFQETPHVRVLLTGRKSLGIPAFGGVGDHPYKLGPLNFANTVRLFAQLCPHLHTLNERAALFKALVINGHQATLCPEDYGVDERTSRIFNLLGKGVPSEIEKAAYGMLKEDLNDLLFPPK